MEQIGKTITNLPASAATGNLPSSSKSASAISCLERYGSARNFLDLFNPENQVKFCKASNLERCYMGTAPRLNTITEAYGNDTTESWIGIQVRDLVNFSGSKEKFSEAHYDIITEVINTEYGHFKVSELMHFFLQFKAGKYGKFYGAVDPLAITEALREFSRERTETLTRYLREMEARRERERAEAHDRDLDTFRDSLRVSNMTISEWMALKRLHPDLTLPEIAEVGWLFRLGYETGEARRIQKEEDDLLAAARNLLG